jgi:hypothetical protein
VSSDPDGTRTKKPTDKTLPPILRAATRAGGGAPDRFLENVVVEQSYPLAALSRGDTSEPVKIEDNRKLLALEAEDGTTVFIRADRLQEEIGRLCPEAVGAAGVDLAWFRDREAATRGGLDWLWSKLSVLSLGRDAIVDAATDLALQWAKDWLGEKVQEAAEAGASWLGAKALMWAIEKRLAGKPGLYQWKGGELAASDRCDPNDPRLVAAAKEGPMLIFIHGAGSHTLASFKDMHAPGAAADWEAVAGKFGERVFGFEHCTFSESPIDNALALVDALPAQARVCLVTHSRGGLVGDLLCLGELNDDLIAAYRREAPVNQKEEPWQQRVREKVAMEEQEKLRKLCMLLSKKEFQIDRYVRVAAPARGTTLLADNLDVFLSGLLCLTGKLVGAVAGPGGSAVLSAFKRIVLEIADKRVDARFVPGIEAMLTDSPMSLMLARAPSRQDVEMAVIAGDIEGGGIIKRLGVLFTDWMFFDRADNDLVVDTASMYAGLARSNKTRYLFDKGERVNHFSYFDNRSTRSAVLSWLTSTSPEDLPAFNLMVEGREPTRLDAREKWRSRGEVTPDIRSVVIVVPGMMGSHLELRTAAQKPGEGNRIWFDIRDLRADGLGKIRYAKPNLHAEALFETFYGDLCDHLEASHTVIRFPYDWRKPIQEIADQLSVVVCQALTDNPNQPVRLLAHSMGGLVVRAMMALNPITWKAIITRDGGRFIMLGTPNNGSHLMVETLLGKADIVRCLAWLDADHNMQRVLEIIAAFPGALQLLPRPGFQDSGGQQEPDYFVNAALWEGFRQHNKDRWFGDGMVGVPDGNVLRLARSLWDTNILGTSNTVPDPERVAYVFGQAENTPCGMRLEGGRLKMIGTPEGDGSVSWASGRLDNLPQNRCWCMPVAHGNLADSKKYFPAIQELLKHGETKLLGRLPVSRGTAATRSYDAGPTPYPTDEEVIRSLLGAKPKRRKTRVTRQRLAVRVVAMDLRHIQLPVMCGHYIGDPIAGAELHIDRHVVSGGLSRRERLGVYAGEIGTSAVVLNPRNEEEVRRATGRGAVILGLGEFGSLHVSQLTETVRAGVLRFLLHTQDRSAGVSEGAAGTGPTEVGLASLLIGYNSTANISVEDAVSAIVRGACLANRQFEDAMGLRLRVGRLEFVELFLDNAITAANAVRALPQRMERELQRLGITLEAADRLIQGDGVRHRLSVSSPFGYWPRLMVTDADRTEDPCAAGQPFGMSVSRTALAKRLKYVFLAERARAEAEFHQRQPGLIEALVKNAIHVDSFNPDLARTLFQLMVPLDFKATVRDIERLVLMLDGFTANLPWEMLQADDEPMVLKTRVVRQLVSTRFRKTVHPSTSKAACVIADPSTEGFQEHFGKSRPLPPLPGAEKESHAVRELLTACNYQVEFVPSESRALDVMSRLFKRPYRILMIAAHGEFELTATDGSERSGVVLSDGVVLTAAEIRQLEVVPDLVFLNCCHVGKIDAVPAYNRLAYSLARELIEMGVRCVVAAGWRVNDQAACTFAEAFFAAFARDGQRFGDAIHEARKKTYASHPGCNTWGAYQAYGDPGFVLEPGRVEASYPPAPVTPQELVAELERLRLAAPHAPSKDLKKTMGEVQDRLSAAPPEWSDLPEIQCALGALYGEFGTDGFEAACAAYQRAIAEDDQAGRVPIKAIEQLANLEARIGEKKGGAQGLRLIESAIKRLEELRACTQPMHAEPDDGADKERMTQRRVNVERCSLLGSALKRKAAILAKQMGTDWGLISKALQGSRDAYRDGEGDPATGKLDPHPALNRLQLEGLLQDFSRADSGGLIQLARRCADLARQRFASSYDFYDAVMTADAELAIRMIDGTLKDSTKELAQAYRDAVVSVLTSARQFDSVVRQLELLAQFYSLRGRGDDVLSATALRKMAHELAPSSAAPIAAQSAQPPESPAGAAEEPAAQADAQTVSETPAKAASKRTRSRGGGKRKA